MAPKGWKDRPLRVIVSRGVLSIEIGVDTLAHSAVHGPYAYDLMGPYPKMPDTRFRIDNTREFAAEVKRSLLEEAEDGSSLLTKLLDDAIVAAIEDGSQAFIDSQDEG